MIGSEWSELGFINVGDIPADWRQRRGAARVCFPEEGANAVFAGADGSADGIRFLDIESVHTREALLPDFEPLLKFYGHADLDVAVVRGHDRRITRYISQWAYEQVDDDECQGSREFPRCDHGNSPPCWRPVRAGRSAAIASRWRRMR